MADQPDRNSFRPTRLTPENSGRFSRLDPERSGRFRGTGVVKPTRMHRTIEIFLFVISAVLLVLAALSLYSSYSSDFRKVPNTMEAGIRNDRVNILLIGVGGKDHPGEDLADAVVLVSLKPSARKVALISIPRDLWVKVGRYGTHRLNLAHAIGNQSGYPGAGAGLTIKAIADVTGQPVHGFIRIDFAAFEKIIDNLGGVEINVQRPFYDTLFKDRFDQGPQVMNGRRALRFARYRYVIGPEGDNYARELRQQQLMTAVKDKLQKRGLTDTLRVAKSMTTLSSHTDTNITTSQLVWLYRSFGDTASENIRHVSLKPFMETFHVTSVSEGGEAVRPIRGDFSAVQTLLANVFQNMHQVGTADDIRFNVPPLGTTSASGAVPAPPTPAVTGPAVR